jgi:hypothetical protein
MTRHRQSTAEKTAIKIGSLVNDLTLDLDQVGMYLGRDNNITYNRLMVILEAAKWEKEEQWEMIQDENYLF